MKFLLSATPVPGHLNPILSIGRLLVENGHEVVVNVATVMRERVEKIGARFVPSLPGADFDLRDMDRAFPERRGLSGAALQRFYFERLFFDPIQFQYAGFREILRDFDADALIVDNYCFGTLPMLLGRREDRPAIIHCGVSYLQYKRDDGAPFHAGYPPAESESERASYIAPRKEIEENFLNPIHEHLDMRLGEINISPLSMNAFDAAVMLPDLYLHPSVPSFEYPRREMPQSVHFVGALPSQVGETTLPAWAHELDTSRRVVLVTQGTVANRDLNQLIGPTLAALADEPDVLVIVTTGNRPLPDLPVPIPANARVATFLPFDWLLPKVDLVVTNGGYGTVNHALKLGIPMVVAGLSEDKAEVSARVAWSGVGINLKTNTPSADALKSAIRQVLDTPGYRHAAARMATDFSHHDAASSVLQLIDKVVNRKV